MVWLIVALAVSSAARDADDVDGLGGLADLERHIERSNLPTSTLTSSNVGLLNPSFLTVIR